MVDILTDNSGFTIEDFTPSTVTLPLPRSETSSSEMATLVSKFLKTENAPQIEEELNMGSELTLDLATEEMQKTVADSAYLRAEQALTTAVTADEVEGIVNTARDEMNRPVSVADFRNNYVVQAIDNADEYLPRIDQLTVRNLELARVAQLASEKIWEEASFLDIVKDFGELIIPVSGMVEDEVSRHNQSVDQAIEQLFSQGTPEQQKAALQSLVSDWSATETKLLGRNNTLLNTSNIDALAQSILTGGIEDIDGGMSEGQLRQHVDSAINLAFGAAELKGIGTGTKGLMKWLYRKMMPKQADDYLDADAFRAAKDRVFSRTGASAKHVEYELKPENALKDAAEKPMHQVAKEHGLTPEQAASEHVPTPSRKTDKGFPSVDLLDRDNLSSLVLTDPELTSIGMEMARKLETETGSSLKVIDSATGFDFDAASDISFGKFHFLLGDKGSAGFKTKELAENAARNNVLGTEYQVVQKDNDWYVEASVTHYFDPERDMVGLGKKAKEATGPVREFLLDPLRVLGGDILKGVFALKGKHRAMAQELEEKANTAFKGMNPHQATRLLKALDNGSTMEKEWSGITSFARDNNLPVHTSATRDLFKRYKEVREVMDGVWQARNKAFFQRKNSLSYKLVNIGEGNLGRRLRGSEIQSEHVWDAQRQRLVGTKDLDGDSIVFKLDNAIDTPHGSYTFVKVRAEDVSALPVNLLNRRKGHIDRMYRDTGWLVQRLEDITLDGKATTVRRTTHIVGSKREADAAAEQLRAEGHTVTTSRSRENDELDALYADDQSVQFGYGSAHTRKRNEQLKGSDGMNAPTLNAFESVMKSVRGVERTYDVDIIRSLESRFKSEFAEAMPLGKATPWDDHFENMVPKGFKATSKEVTRAAKQWHSYIKTLKGMSDNALYAWIDDALAPLEGLGFGSLKTPAVKTRKVVSEIAKAVSHVIVLGRPLFQVPQNFSQLAFVAMRDPAHGPAAIARMPFILPYLTGDTDNFWMLSKALGTTETIARDLIAEIKSNGLWSGVSRADDYLQVTKADGKIPATSVAGKVGKTLKGVARSPFTASQWLQEGSVKLVNLAAYLSEFQAEVVRKGRPFNARTKADVSFNAQRVTATQNGINQFFYQKKGSPLQLMLQFMQHIHKVYLDIVLDPMVKAVSGKNIGKTPSALAESRKQAAFTVLAVASTFGLNGLLGERIGSMTGDKLREIDPSADEGLVEFILEGGLLNTLANWAGKEFLQGEGSVDVSSKMGPAAFLDVFQDFYLNNPGTLETLGATASVGGDVWNRVGPGGSAWALMQAPELDTAEKVEGVARELGTIIKGFSDYEKATIAYHMGNWPYTSSLASDMKVTKMEAVYGLMNIPSSLVADYYNHADFGSSKKRKEVSEKLAETAIRMMTRQLAEEAKEGTLDPLRSVDIQAKWVRFAKAGTDPKDWDMVENLIRTRAMNSTTSTYERYIKNYIDSSDVGDRVKSLSILLQKADDPEARREIQSQIEFYEMFDSYHEQTYEYQ